MVFPNNNFHIQTKPNTNTIPNTTMTKQNLLLRKNTGKTLSILDTNLENKIMKNYQITLSNQKKYIWFLIPKCGSNSIRNFLHKNSEIVSNEQFKEAVRTGIDWENYFKFIIVRNPWDRLLSAWQDKVRKQWDEKYRFPQFRIKYFEQFHDKDFSFFC